MLEFFLTVFIIALAMLIVIFNLGQLISGIRKIAQTKRDWDRMNGKDL